MLHLSQFVNSVQSFLVKVSLSYIAPSFNLNYFHNCHIFFFPSLLPLHVGGIIFMFKSHFNKWSVFQDGVSPLFWYIIKKSIK